MVMKTTRWFFSIFLKLRNGDFQLLPGKLHKKKQGQMKIQQMAFMLMAITLFFVLVGMLVLVIKFSGLKDSAQMLENKNAMLLATKIANSPEFSCGRAFGNQINCIDVDKVMALKKNIDKYDNFWGLENIKIRWIYPSDYSEIDCATTYPNCGIINLMEGEISAEYSNYVTLCRKASYQGQIYNKCELGRIMLAPKEV